MQSQSNHWMLQFPLKNSKFQTSLPLIKANQTPSRHFANITDFAIKVSTQFNGQEKAKWIDECGPSSETAEPRLTPDNKRAPQPNSWSIAHAKPRPPVRRSIARLFARSWRLLLQRPGRLWTPLYLRDLGGLEHKGEVTFFWSAVLALEPEHTNEELLKWQNARRELCGGIVADVKRMFPLEQLLGGSNHCRVCSSQ